MGTIAQGPHYSIDVECVATGPQHHDRDIAQIGMVNSQCEVLYNAYVKPEKPVVSYLEPLTGLSAELIEQQGIPVEDAKQKLRELLPKNAILVGQNIGKDVEWLGLERGVDFVDCVDLATLFRVWNDGRGGWTMFSQLHVAATWLGEVQDPEKPHDAVGDATISMRLFHAYTQVQNNPEQHTALQQATISAPRVPSFAMQYPTYQGCCQGNRKLCTCGAPFFA